MVSKVKGTSVLDVHIIHIQQLLRYQEATVLVLECRRFLYCFCASRILCHVFEPIDDVTLFIIRSV